MSEGLYKDEMAYPTGLAITLSIWDSWDSKFHGIVILSPTDQMWDKVTPYCTPRFLCLTPRTKQTLIIDAVFPKK